MAHLIASGAVVALCTAASRLVSRLVEEQRAFTKSLEQRSEYLSSKF